jgi:hypothetical protein
MYLFVEYFCFDSFLFLSICSSLFFFRPLARNSRLGEGFAFWGNAGNITCRLGENFRFGFLADALTFLPLLLCWALDHSFLLGVRSSSSL